MSRKVSNDSLYKALGITSIFVLAIIAITFLPTNRIEAASLNKIFTFASTTESWAGNGGISTVDSYQSSVGNPAGALQSTISGRNKVNTTAGWLLSGLTWEDLGVPVGSTVNTVDGRYDWQCSEYTTGNSKSASGDLTITDSSDGNSTTIESGVTFGATTTWATRNASANINIPASLNTSNTSIKIKLLGSLLTGNSNSAFVTRQMDNISLIIDYSASPTPTPTPTPGPTTNQLKSIEQFISQESTVKIAGSTSSMGFNIDIAETSPIVKSAFIEIQGVSSPSAAQVIDVDVDGVGKISHSLDTSNNVNFRIIFDLNNYLSTKAPPNNYILNIKPVTASVSVLSAKLILTYQYSG